MRGSDGKAESMSEAPTPETSASNRRVWPKYIRRTPRSLVPPSTGGIASYDTLMSRALSWVLPWSLSTYPGVSRGAAELLSGAATRHAIRAWRRGQNPMPRWAAEMLAGYIRARLASGQALLAELESYQPPERKPGGFCRVDPATGRDARNRTGKTTRD